MNTLTKLALGIMGRSKLPAAEGIILRNLVLPPPEQPGGLGFMGALRRRQAQREVLPEALSLQTISNLVWAASSVNPLKNGDGIWC